MTLARGLRRALEADGRHARVGVREARRRLPPKTVSYRESKNASSIFLSLSLDASYAFVTRAA